MPYASGRTIHDADAHIMETPTWLRDHADPGLRDRIAPLRYPSSGNELRQTGDPDEQLRDLTPPSTGWPPSTRSDEYRAIEAERDHAPQELRGHRLVPRRGPAAGARPARLLEPARVQHVPQPAAARLGARRRPRARRTARPGPTTAAWSSSARSTTACCPPATCRSSTSTRPPAPGRRGASPWAPPRCSSPRAARRATRRATSGLDPVWAKAQEAGHPRSCSTSAAPAT